MCDPSITHHKKAKKTMSQASIVSVSQTSFRLKISSVSTLNEVFSPIQVVQDIPWKVKISKSIIDGKQSLGVHLICAKTDTSPNWSNAASVSFKLVSLEGANCVESKTEPYAFNYIESSIGFTTFVDWIDLFDMKKKFVNDDAIQLDVNIEAADPHELNPSIMVVSNSERCCENDCLVTFQLNVININNLMAVRSPQFVLRGLLWDFSIYKDHSSRLGIRLGSRTTTDRVTCKVRMTAKLLSTEAYVTPVEKVKTMIVRRFQIPLTDQLITWSELFDPDNGYVENDSISMEIEFKIDKPEFIPSSDQNGNTNWLQNEVKIPKMECAVCLEAIHKQNISCPPCGHLFCSDCISNAAETRKSCPSCNVSVTLRTLRRVYLPL